MRGAFIINGSKSSKFGFDFTVKKITLDITHRAGAVNAANTRLRLITHGKERTASGVFNDDYALIFSFDFAVGEHDGFRVDFQRPSGIMQANATILIEI